MQSVGPVSSLPVVRDFRLTGPVPASASAAPPQDQVTLEARASEPGPTALPVVARVAHESLAVPLAQPPTPQVLVDLDGHLGQPALAGEGPTFKAADSNPSVLTQFDPQSGNQVRIDQQAFQDTLTLDLGGPASVTLQHVDDLSELNGRLPSPAELSKLTAAFYDSSKIPFEYIKDGCYARAHLICESLRQHGINHSKVFVFGSLGAKNDVQDAKWWYHVAPMVFVQDPVTGAVDARVIDPGLSREPMSVADWVQAVNRGDSVRLDLTRAAQYTPRERSGVPLSFEQNLGPAQNTLMNYANALTMLAPQREGPVRGGNLADGQAELFPEGLPAPPPDFISELTRMIMASEPGKLPPMMPMMSTMPMPGLGAIGGMMGMMVGMMGLPGGPGFKPYGTDPNAPPGPGFPIPPLGLAPEQVWSGLGSMKDARTPPPGQGLAAEHVWPRPSSMKDPASVASILPPGQELAAEHVWPGPASDPPSGQELAAEHVRPSPTSSPPLGQELAAGHVWPGPASHPPSGQGLAAQHVWPSSGTGKP